MHSDDTTRALCFDSHIQPYCTAPTAQASGDLGIAVGAFAEASGFHAVAIGTPGTSIDRRTLEEGDAVRQLQGMRIPQKLRGSAP